MPNLQQASDFDDFLMPSLDDVKAQATQSHKDPSERRNPANYLRVPPPDGAKDWRGAKVGSSNYVDFWLAPMYAPGKFGFGERSHFYKTDRIKNGTSILCTGNKCLLCAAWFAFKDQEDEDTKNKVAFCKRKFSTLFNVINLSDPSAQTYDDGTVKPLIAAFTSTVARMLYEILDMHGPGICHPQTGRGIRWKKRKDGERMTEVSSYLSALPEGPLDRDMWHLCKPQNLWQLHELSESLLPTPEEQADVLADLGLPVITGPNLPIVSAKAAFAHEPPVKAIPAARDMYSDGREAYQRQIAARTPAPPNPAALLDGGPPDDEELPPIDEYYGPPLEDDEVPEAHSNKPARDEEPWKRYSDGAPKKKGK
jgi:hypothetical protein